MRILGEGLVVDSVVGVFVIVTLVGGAGGFGVNGGGASVGVGDDGGVTTVVIA